MKTQNKHGFTLIELMVVVGVVGLIGVTATSIFMTISRSQKQAEIRERMKQDGDYGLSVMSKMLRQAEEISCVSSSEITLESPDGYSTTFECSSTSIASTSANSSTLIENTDYEIVCDNFVTCSGTGTNLYVEIDYQLQTGTDSSALPYQQATMSFNTTVSPRNLE